MTQQVQKRNAQMVDLLRQDFQHRREPNYAWSRVTSMYLALPGLRAFWPMSRVISSVSFPAAPVRALDVGGGILSNDLANTAALAPTFGYDSLAPYADFNGTTQYLFRADGGAANWADILGTEAYIVAAQRGLTLGCWVNFDRVVGTSERIMTKDAGGVQRSYALQRAVAGSIRFLVTTDGFTVVPVDSTSIPTDTGGWYFIAGRFEPSTALTVFVNDAQDQNLVGIPATIFDSTASFYIGTWGALTAYLDGKVSMAFLCAAALSDASILSLYEQTRALYGV